MSFSSEVKEELSQPQSQARHCRIALIAALFHLCPELTQDCAGIRTENRMAAQAYEQALRKVWGGEVRVRKQGREYTVSAGGKDGVKKFLEMMKLDDRIHPDGSGEAGLQEMVKNTRVSPVLLQKTCCRRAFLKGLFLAAGSVSDPSKSYHLEIAPLSEQDAEDVVRLLSSVGFGARITKRKGRSVVYLKEGEQISDFLGSIGATGSLMKLENARILKDIAGNINRQVNFETANLKKTGIASERQMEDIALIERTVGIASLSESLQQAARLRMENPDASLQELASSCQPPVGRSGFNHRLKRISEIAAGIRRKAQTSDGSRPER